MNESVSQPSQSVQDGSDLSQSVQYSAGGVVYRRLGDQIEICLIQDSYGRWTFPKGHQEPNESLIETARREIAEETGIEPGALVKKGELGEVSYWFISSFKSDRQSGDHSTIQIDGQTGPTEPTELSEPVQPIRIHKFVTYFLFEAPADTALTAQAGEVSAIEWVELDQLESRSEYENNVPIVQKVLDWLGPSAIKMAQ